MDLQPYVGSGKIIYDSQMIDPDKRILDQLSALDEDLLQVEYAGGYLIDLGWYPSVEFDGGFLIFVLRDCDWDCPIVRLSFRRIKHVPVFLQMCATLVESLIKAGERSPYPVDRGRETLC